VDNFIHEATWLNSADGREQLTEVHEQEENEGDEC